MTTRSAGEYNPEAFGAHILAEEAYLRANGWQALDGPYWTHGGKELTGGPAMKDRDPTDRSHAVNVQKQFDARCAAFVASQIPGAR